MSDDIINRLDALDDWFDGRGFRTPAVVAEAEAEIVRLRKAVGEQTESARKWKNRAQSRASKLKKAREELAAQPQVAKVAMRQVVVGRWFENTSYVAWATEQGYVRCDTAEEYRQAGLAAGAGQ